MDVLYTACAGLDVHQATIVACVRQPGAGRRRVKEVRTFGTTTSQLLALVDWLTEHGVSHVAMESTGVLWKPVFNLLEGSFTVLLVNARHIKAVPGRKTDVRDCEWEPCWPRRSPVASPTITRSCSANCSTTSITSSRRSHGSVAASPTSLVRSPKTSNASPRSRA